MTLKILLVLGLIAIILVGIGFVLMAASAQAKARRTASSGNALRRPESAPLMEKPLPFAAEDLRLVHFHEVVEAWRVEDYNQARFHLQKIAYGMVGKQVKQETKDAFTRLMTAFASEDPLYQKIMEQLLPIVRDNPGVIQSRIYPGESEEIKEHMRYVIYFADALGVIRRVKKGNSYQLFLPGSEATDDKPRLASEDIGQKVAQNDAQIDLSTTQGKSEIIITCAQAEALIANNHARWEEQQERTARLAGLHKKATEFSRCGDLEAALKMLRDAQAQARRYSLPQTPERWSRLPLYLQKTGHFAEAMQEFEKVLRDVERQAVEQASAYPEYFRAGFAHHPKFFIYDKMRLACRRQKLPNDAKKYASLATAALHESDRFNKIFSLWKKREGEKRALQEQARLAALEKEPVSENRLRIFRAACERVLLKGIVAPLERINILMNGLPERLARYDSQGRNSYQLGAKIIMEVFSGSDWHYPEYENWLVEENRQYEEIDTEDRDFIEQSDISNLITLCSISRLRELYREFAGENAPSPGRGIADVGNALYNALTEPQKLLLAERLRNEFLAELDSERLLTREIDHPRMAEALCRRIGRTANILFRLEQVRDPDFAENYPLLEYHTGEKDGIPEECARRNGIRYRNDDPIWDSIPCACPDCFCDFGAVRKTRAKSLANPLRPC